MIRETDIEIALKAAIETGNLGWSIAWPNQDHNGNKPYIQVDFVRTGRRDDTMEGENTVSAGRIMASVVVKRGTSTRTANQKADALAAIFPMGRRIPVDGGEIVIMKPADVMEGYRQDAEWRVPVRIDYEAN